MAYWCRAVASGAPPSARCAHTSISLAAAVRNGEDRPSPNEAHSRLLVFGGGDGARRFKDVYVLDVPPSDFPGNKRKNGRRNSSSAGAAAAAGKVGVGDAAPSRRPKTVIAPSERYNESLRMSGERKTTLRVLLASCDLAHLYDAFTAQNIDSTILPMLTESHLRELGVDTIGARLRLMKAARDAANAQSGMTGISCSSSNNSNVANTNNASCIATAGTTGSAAMSNRTMVVKDGGSSNTVALLNATRSLDAAIRQLTIASEAVQALLPASRMKK